jgi:hypothetical protein
VAHGPKVPILLTQVVVSELPIRCINTYILLTAELDDRSVMQCFKKAILTKLLL